MKNNRGQALVEFIMILPVFLLIVLAIMDFGKIYHTKYMMQNDLNLIANLYNENKVDEYNNYANNNELKLKTTKNGNLVTLEISKKIEILTPGLDRILGNPYQIKESMTIYENE